MEDIEITRLRNDVEELKRRVHQLEHLLSQFQPTLIEVDVPNGDSGKSKEPPPKKQMSILGTLMNDVEGLKWTPFEDCDGNKFKVQTRDFTAGS